MLEQFPFLDAEVEQANARRYLRIRGLTVHPAFTQRITRPDSRISWLTTLLHATPAEKVLQATPFFWFCLGRAFAAVSQQRPDVELDHALDALAVAALDSFADVAAAFPREPFDTPPLESRQLLRHGIVLPSQIDSNRAAVGGGELRIAVGKQSWLTLRSPRIAPRVLDAAPPLRRLTDSMIALGASERRIEHDEIAIECLLDQIEHSFTRITQIAPLVASLLAREVQFVVPLQRGEHSHYSFTISNLPGLLFIGGSPELLPIVEAVVHEVGHARLHHANEVFELVEPMDKALYYSPWRNDPRPASGVLHAAYVFTLVLSFWLQALGQHEARLSEAERAYVEDRTALVSLQLREAHDVLERAPLTPFARTLSQTLRAILVPEDNLPIPLWHLDRARTQVQAKRRHAAAETPGLIMPAEVG